MCEKSLVSIEKNGYLAQVNYDPFPINPLEDADRIIFAQPNKRGEFPDAEYPEPDTCWSWDDFDAWIEAEYPRAVSLPVYKFDHSMVAYKSGPFSGPYARWDSGRVGVIIYPADRVRDDYSRTRISKKLRAQVEGLLNTTLDTLTKYVNGQVYYAWIEDIETGETIDSISGLYFDTPEEALDEAVNGYLTVMG